MQPVILPPADLRTRIVAIIRERIGSHNLTCSQMAARLQISQPHLSNILWGRRAPSDQLVEEAIQSLRITPEQVYSRYELDLLRKRPAPPRKRGPRPLHWYSSEESIHRAINAGNPLPDELLE